MFTSVSELLLFLEKRIYAERFKGSFLLDPATIDENGVRYIAQAKQLGYITVNRSTEPGAQNLFDVALTPTGLIEVLLTPRSIQQSVDDPFDVQIAAE
jgi:hypothetical protein